MWHNPLDHCCVLRPVLCCYYHPKSFRPHTASLSSISLKDVIHTHTHVCTVQEIRTEKCSDICQDKIKCSDTNRNLCYNNTIWLGHICQIKVEFVQVNTKSAHKNVRCPTVISCSDICVYTCELTVLQIVIFLYVHLSTHLFIDAELHRSQTQKYMVISTFKLVCFCSTTWSIWKGEKLIILVPKFHTFPGRSTRMCYC